MKEELKEIESILENPNFTIDKIIKYRQETLESIEFKKNHGIDPHYDVKSMKIWNACLALMA